MAEGTRSKNVVWEPQPGPQTALVKSPIFEILFGGSRGGGKTDAMVGDWLSHSDLYGEHAIGLMVRRKRTELVETIERFAQVCRPLGGHVVDNVLKMPNGARLRFSYLERDADADNYQGHSYCVSVGTPIRMADGSLRPIESITKGEFIATLEGPRRVLATVAPYRASCVRAEVRDETGVALGSQIHPVWHPVLTTAGLISSRTRTTRQTAVQPPLETRARDTRGGGSRRDADREIPAWFAWSEDGRSDCRGSLHAPRDGQRPRSLTVPVVLHAPGHPSGAERGLADPAASTGCRARGRWPAPWLGLSRGWIAQALGLQRLVERALSEPDRSCRDLPNADACAPNGSPRAPGSQADCLCDPDCGGGQLRARAGSAPSGTPSQGGAGSRRRAWLSGVWDTIRGHNRSRRLSWVHPYTGEERHLSERVRPGTMELTWHGEAWVADLCVEGANHYISDTGLINKNTRVYVEEIGNFPRWRPIAKLIATLRSGHGVPVGFRATANPGGPGHNWVRSRYIDPAPLGWKVVTDPVTSLERIYIPSRLQDNKYLGQQYINQLRDVGSPALVKAWLEGDWNAIEGAYFPEWSTDRHVLPPFPVPSHWQRFRSMDWGSAKPFSVGWWAIVAEDTPLSSLVGLGGPYRSTGLYGAAGGIRDAATTAQTDHVGLLGSGLPRPGVEAGGRPVGAGDRILPRGAIVRYREWYGSDGQPNVGLKLTAPEVAKKIIQKSGDEAFRYTVIDPSMFAQNGGPSLAEMMIKAGLTGLRMADNKRVGTLGSMGGWDQVRGRLRGPVNDNGECIGDPMLYVFSTCVDFIRTVPVLQHDPDHPEDIDTEAEDHVADETRYAVMSRPMKPKQAEPETVRKDELVYVARPDGSVTSNLSVREAVEARMRRKRAA